MNRIDYESEVSLPGSAGLRVFTAGDPFTGTDGTGQRCHRVTALKQLEPSWILHAVLFSLSDRSKHFSAVQVGFCVIGDMSWGIYQRPRPCNLLKPGWNLTSTLAIICWTSLNLNLPVTRLGPLA